MKKLFTIVLLLGNLIIAGAQNPYDVSESQMPYNQLATGFTANILGANEDILYYEWEKFVEKHGGTTYLVSIQEGNIEMESLHVNFPALNDQVVTLHTRFAPNYSEDGVLLTLWIQLPDGSYYSSKTHKDSADKIKSWLLSFDEQMTDLH